jgi:16S rRNA processing protein RimM
MSPFSERDGDGGRDDRLLSVGAIVKPHGLKGEVVVHLTSNRPERLEPGSELRDRSNRAYRVVEARPHKNGFLVTFEGVNSLEDASACRGTELFAHPIDDPGELWVHDLVGCQVEDSEGRLLGVVTELQANPASDLLVLDGGGLIPLRFVVETTPGERIVVSIPDGLLDPA